MFYEICGPSVQHNSAWRRNHKSVGETKTGVFYGTRLERATGQEI